MWKNTILKILFRVVLFVVVFSGTALIVNAWSNRGSDRSYVELGGATLPVVYACYGEQPLSKLPAYKQEMDPSLIRDSVLPVGEEKEVQFAIENKGGSLGEVSYQLRSSTGEILIEEGTARLSVGRNGRTIGSVTLRMDMARDQSYAFVVLVSYGQDTLRYYMRLVRNDHPYIDAYLAEADAFHKLLLSGDKAGTEDEVRSHMEVDYPEDYDREDLGFVCFFSSYDTLTWAKLKPEIVGDTETALTELYDDGGTVVWRYTVNTVEEETGEIRTYEVEENFVMEYVPELAAARITDYFRRMNRVFNHQQFERNINGIRLGPQDSETEFKTSEDNHHMAFAMGGSVYYYDYMASTLARIFGGESDRTAFAKKEAVRILSVDQDNVYFAIYGRISSGLHEGENGILVEQYKIAERAIEERAFISTNLSYEWMEKETGKLLYLDLAKEDVYYLLGQTLRVLHLSTEKEEALRENLPASEVLVSRSGSVVAFPEDPSESGGAGTLSLWDLKAETKKTIKENGRRLQGLKFIGEDFVYGSAEPGHISLAADGKPVFLYSDIKIVRRNGEKVKDYGTSGMLLSEVRFLNNTIYLSRLNILPDGVLSEATPDYITYKLSDVSGETVLEKSPGVDGYAIVFPTNIYMTSVPEILIAKAGTEHGYEVKIRGETDSTVGYLFRAGELIDYSRWIGTLVAEAVDRLGYVVMADGSTLYRRKTGAPYLTVADKVEYVKAEEGDNGYAACLVMSLQMSGTNVSYESAKRALEESKGSWEAAFQSLSGNDVRGLNLTGADLDTAILFLGDGIPFATKLSGQYVFVVSFNADAIRYYDPIKNTEIRTARSQFNRDVRSAGNEFYTYVK